MDMNLMGRNASKYLVLSLHLHIAHLIVLNVMENAIYAAKDLRWFRRNVIHVA